MLLNDLWRRIFQEFLKKFARSWVARTKKRMLQLGVRRNFAFDDARVEPGDFPSSGSTASGPGASGRSGRAWGGVGSAKLGKLMKIQNWQFFLQILQIFGGLVLGCIEANFCNQSYQSLIFQQFSRSTRFTCFCTAQTSIC